jgi:riboflavin biosynthesis pyrimidine reductase
VEPLRTLVDDPASGADLPEALAALYDGQLAISPDACYCNFVASLDGVVSLDLERGRGPATISLHSEADRFVMALLRALADCVIVGAGTVRDGWNHHWTPQHVYPPLAEQFAKLRRRCREERARSDPELVVVTGRGELDPAQPTLDAGALVLTTDAGAVRLAGRMSAGVRVRSLGSGRLTGRAITEAVRSEGHRRLLTEGGPMLLGTLVDGGLVDELFLTLSPVLAGRNDSFRLALLRGVELLPGRLVCGRLRSLRSHGSHLFLRYALGGAEGTGAGGIGAEITPARRRT